MSNLYNNVDHVGVMAEGSKESLSEGLQGLLKLGVTIFLIWGAISYLSPDDWKIKYIVRYFAPYCQVTVEPKPTKCDWWHAPIGDKACHYEAVVSTTVWEKSTDGHPIVSYNDGETWLADDPPPKIAIPTTFVFVGWDEKKDP